MKKVRSKEDEFIIEYFRKINLEQSRDKAQLISRLNNKHDKNLAQELIDYIDTNTYSTSDYFYRLKNSSLELSIDVSSYFTDLYRQCFKELIKRSGIKYDTILDIGCDNGIASCFLALIFPKAEIVGIDISDKAVENAVQLADSLNLSNVKFMNIDFLDIRKYFSEKYFDLIFSICTINEMAEFNEDRRCWSIREYKTAKRNRTVWALFLLIKKMLKNNSSDFIAFERLENSIDAAVWVNQLMELDMFVDWKNVKMVHYHELGTGKQIPMIVSSGTLVDYDISDNVIKLYTGIEHMVIGSDKEFEGVKAELAFDQFIDKEFVDGLQIDYNNGLGSLRYELWREPSFLLLYQYSDVGYKKLSLVSKIYLDQIKDELNKLRVAMAGSDNTILSLGDIDK